MTKLSILEESVRPKPKRLIARVLAALDAGTASAVHVARLVETAQSNGSKL